jgi:hypothetical protein
MALFLKSEDSFNKEGMLLLIVRVFPLFCHFEYNSWKYHQALLLLNLAKTHSLAI